MARAQERSKELDNMSRKEVIRLYKSTKVSSDLPTRLSKKKKKLCGLKRRDTGEAC